MTGSPRLSARFAALKAADRAGLIAYVMAGDPDLETTLPILRAAVAAGADVIELGFPFTDPMADGPTIQRAALRALASGTTLARVLDLVARFRAEDADTPLILMGYSNPIERMGLDAFAERAATAGMDGAIVVDLPPEEDFELRAAFAPRNLSLIRLATPTTDEKRLPTVLDGVSGFLYYVSLTGVTGVQAVGVEAARAAAVRLKAATDLPVAVGFGVRDPDVAAAIARSADAVVVGSAIVDAIADGPPETAPQRVADKVGALAAAVRQARLPSGALR
ncbi:MAG: tryptophan synthase subunit alpha [Caulobacterales bacterium]